jgi:Co/Zn/Cd efflux system component
MQPTDTSLRRVVLLVAALNLGYFGVELVVARSIGSVALFADSIDFLEDFSVNLLIFLALGWTVAARARVGMVLAGILVVPALSFVWALWDKFNHPLPPEPFVLSLTGGGALLINLVCAFSLARFRLHGGSLTKAAFLSARNDSLANVAIILAGLVTAATGSIWPDIIIGLGIAAMNADAAYEVWVAARSEKAAQS